MDEIQEIVDFVIREGEGLYSNIDRKKLEDIIRKHIGYGTFLQVKDKKGIVAVARWNISPDSKVVYILDTVVKKGYRKPQIMRQMVALGISRNPKVPVMWIAFERRTKYPDRKVRVYNIDKFLKRRRRK